MNITQSLIKALSDYIQGNECGIRIREQYIYGIEFEASEPMAIGMYFEYRAFGTLPKSGKIPLPKTKKTKKGQSAQQSELLKKYELADNQAENIKKAIKHYQFEILSKGKKIYHTLSDGTVAEGTMDLELKTTIPIEVYNHETGNLALRIPANTLITADVKNSGLLGDRGKWSEMGWHPDFLDQKHRLMTQAVHYSYIQQKIHGKPVPFMFMVYSQSNDIDALWYYVDIDPDKIEAHEELIISTRLIFESEEKKGFTAVPSLERCAKCDLAPYCKFKQEVPKVILVSY